MTYTHKTGVYALYLAAIVLAAVLYFALDGTDLCGNTPMSRYVVNLVCIAVTAAAVFVVVSWEKLGFVARQLQSPDESTVRRAVRVAHFVRTGAFALALNFNVLAYCLASYAENPKYCVLISLVLGIMAFPKFDKHHEI